MTSIKIQALILAISISACLLSACGKKTEPSLSAPASQGQSASNLTVKNLNLAVSAAELAASKQFAYFEGGHFGDKTQYNGSEADELGGAYAVHCRSGKPFSIEVKYQGDGIERSQALVLLERLLPPDKGKLIEHDDEDLQKMDAPQAAEFFYFEAGPKAEFLFAPDSNKNVVQVNVWSKDG